MKNILALSALIVGCCNAETIYVEFGTGPAQTGPAALPGGPNATWNLFGAGPGSGVSLDDTDGNLSAITMSYNDSGLVTPTGQTGFGAGYTDLADGYLVTSTSNTISLAGLTPGDNFSLYIYSQRAGVAESTQVSVTGLPSQTAVDTANPGAFVQNTNYLVFNGTVDGTGDLTITYANSSAEGDVNGLQLVTSSATPEPAAWSLIACGLGFVGFIRRRR